MKLKLFSDQIQLDLQTPTSFLHLLQKCLTSLQEFKHRQQQPVHKKGNSKKHQVLEAHPCSYSISVIVKSLQPSQFIKTGILE
jgi:hypothetical protein